LSGKKYKVSDYSLLKARLHRKEEDNKKDFRVRPVFFRLRRPSDREACMQLLKEKPFISVHSEIDAQLKELVKSMHPGKGFTEEEVETAIKLHLNGTLPEEYGVWVYYPWSERLVHLLDEEEFIELRTNRNQFKITREERNLLSTKKIGIIGLSVGQSVALTMAMERTFGELRIADFDTLELSNLNRIRTGLHNLGIPKVVAVAREIAEIDPFLKVTCYGGGVTEKNMENFFLDGGKLDTLVDECDSLDIKLAVRRFARSRRIPVLMDTSDRGMLDIERFDLEPERPLFHGLIHEDLVPEGGSMATEQRIEIAVKIAGGNTISDRLKSSIVQIGKTISTWPQLASSVVLGGAVTTHVCRMILLGLHSRSGRFYVDVDQIIA